MKNWIPSKEWQGEDAYIIGGGPSLRSFDWDLLRDKKTIGCNSAFMLGADLVPITVFGDHPWWLEIGRHATAYQGRMVGCSPRLHNARCPWLYTMKRIPLGMGTVDTLGWNGNTGSLAINLALILGVARIFLLGFDMSMDDKPNWHEMRHQDPTPENYPRFVKLYKHVARGISIKFPDVEVVNVTDGSKLTCFPKRSIEDHFVVATGMGMRSAQGYQRDSV